MVVGLNVTTAVPSAPVGATSTLWSFVSTTCVSSVSKKVPLALSLCFSTKVVPEPSVNPISVAAASFVWTMPLSSIVTCSVAGLGFGLGLAFGFGFAFALGLAAVLTAVWACTVGFSVESQLATAAVPAVRCRPRREIAVALGRFPGGGG